MAKGRPEPCDDNEDVDNDDDDDDDDDNEDVDDDVDDGDDDDDDDDDDDNEDVDDDGGREVGGGSVKVVSSRPQLPSHPLTLIKIIIIIWISSFAIEKHIVKQEQL